MRNFVYIVVFYLSLIGLQAQELLTKDEALRISLEQNFDIKCISGSIFSLIKTSKE